MPTEFKRTSLLLPPRTQAELVEDCYANEINMNEAIRRAITERAYWRKVRERGAVVTITEPDGESYRVETLT